MIEAGSLVTDDNGRIALVIEVDDVTTDDDGNERPQGVALVWLGTPMRHSAEYLTPYVQVEPEPAELPEWQREGGRDPETGRFTDADGNEVTDPDAEPGA